MSKLESPIIEPAQPVVPVLKATNVKIKLEIIDIPARQPNPATGDPGMVAGNKAARYSFTSDILKDGVLFKNYNEPSWGLDGGKSPEATAQRIIRNHLDYWTGVLSAPDSIDAADIDPTQQPEPPTQDELDAQAQAQAVYAAVQKIKAINLGIAQGILNADDADLAAAKQVVSDAIAANSDFKSALIGLAGI